MYPRGGLPININLNIGAPPLYIFPCSNMAINRNNLGIYCLNFLNENENAIRQIISTRCQPSAPGIKFEW